MNTAHDYETARRITTHALAMLARQYSEELRNSVSTQLAEVAQSFGGDPLGEVYALAAAKAKAMQPSA